MKYKIRFFIGILLFMGNLLLSPAIHSYAAQSGTCGENISWTLDEGTLTISGTGEIPNSLRDRIVEPIYIVIIEDGITSIAEGTFVGCNDLTNIIISDSVTSIGDVAFADCRNLTSIIIPNSVTSIGTRTFGNCRSLTSVIIPNSVISIGEYAFDNCSALKGIVIPDSVISIGDHAFDHCTDLLCINIPDSVTLIGDYAFSGCTSLENMEIPNTVTSMGSEVFLGCTSLSSISVPSSLLYTDYGNGYRYLSTLKSINFSGSATYIPEYAFSDMISLESVRVPEGVTIIKTGAFQGCYSLNNIFIPSTCTIIEEHAFSNPSLEDVYFEGSESQWEAITIRYGNESLNSATIHYNYVPIRESIQLNANSLILALGTRSWLDVGIITEATTDDINNLRFDWTSSNTSVVAIEPNYQYPSTASIVSQGVGTAIITVSYENMSTMCVVTVVDVTEISLNKSTLELVVDEEETLSATMSPANIIDAHWYSQDPYIATVDQNGKVTGVNVGITSITCSAGYVSDTCRVTVNPVDVADVSLNQTSLSLIIGDDETLVATVLPENATDNTITWESSDTSVATVDANGLVTAIGVGTTVITASAGDEFDECTVYVSYFLLNKSSLTLSVGDNETLAVITPENVSYDTVTWSSSDESVATVDSNGRVTAMNVGLTAISASTYDGFISIPVTVNPVAVTDITLNQTSLDLYDGDHVTLIATVTPENATDKTVTWTSSDTSVVTVNANGSVSAINVGTATITASAGEESATCTVNVSPVAVTGVALDRTRLNLYVGENETLVATVTPENATDKTVTWTSSNTSVVTVNANGRVSAINVGTVTITASAGEEFATCTVTVSPVAVTGVALNHTSLNLCVGDDESLVATVTPNSATDKTVTWTSSDTSVVTVNTNGRVSAINIGTATITASAGEESATCTVIVNPVAVTGVALNHTTLDLYVGDDETLTATVTPENATDNTVTWTSSNTSIATVDSNGKITGIAPGTVTITATAGEISETCIVNVSYELIASGTCGENLTWTLDCAGTLIISGTGPMTDYSTDSPWRYDSRIKDVVIGDKVTSIGKYAFYGCRALINILIPNSVNSIGVGAFYNCDHLTEVIIPNSVSTIEMQTFCGCAALVNVTIPDSITSIGGYGFCDCTSLENIVIPDSVESIGDFAFTGCTSLTGINLPNSISYIYSRVFKGCTSLSTITIPDSVIYIYSYAFENCSSLESVVIPNSVVYIFDYAFEGCSSLENITIPESVRSISDYAFKNCTSLTNITFQDSVNVINKYVFEGDTSLEEFYVPIKVSAIREYAFLNCTSLTRIGIPKSCTTIDTGAFRNCPITDIYFEGNAEQWNAITIKNYNDSLSEATIHYNCWDIYYVPAENIYLNTDYLSLRIGDSQILTPAVNPFNVTDTTVIWTSSDTSIATVDSSGRVTALKIGSVTITARADDKTATCQVDVYPVNVDEVILNKSTLSLNIGDSETLSVTITPENATDKSVTWTSYDTSVATVDSNGKVTAINTGTTTIMATSGDCYVYCTVTVNPIVVSDITFNKTTLALYTGDYETLIATVMPANANDKTVTWSSSDTSVATVNANGKVTAINPGTAYITARAGDKSTTCTVTVNQVSVTGITLNRSTLTLDVGSSELLTASVIPDNATDKNVVWSSSDTSIATVDSNGKVTAVKPGTVYITARAGDKSVTCTVTVNQILVIGITLNRSTLTLDVGSSELLTASVTPDNATDKNVVWSSSDTSIATVDSNGKVTAVKPGTAYITAKAGDKSVTCTVTVNQISVTGITLNRSTLTLDVGVSESLTATVTPANAADKNVVWSSSDTSIATVDSNGKVTAVKPGVAFITARAGEKSATCTVTVNHVSVDPVAVTGITLNKTSLTLTEGNSELLTATVSPSDATDKTVTWTSSDTSVATVDSNGKVTAINAGTATITASAGGKSATCSIVVESSNPYEAYGLSDEYVPDNYVDNSGSSMIIDGKNLSWNEVHDKSYWYEEGIKQGTYYDPHGVMGDGTVRGREIYDAESDGWYWLDSVYDGAKAVGKEVWIPYIYQDEDEWDEAKIREIANESDEGMRDLVYDYIIHSTGKWVRYDENGRMLKGWVTIEGALAEKYPNQVGNVYYYDTRTGLMAKGYITMDGVTYYFNEVTGVLQN